MRKVTVIAIGIVLLFGFYLFSREVKRGFMKAADFAATVKIQDRIDKSAHLRLAALVDNVMDGSSFFAGPEFTSVVVLLITALSLRKKGWKAIAIPVLFAAIVAAELYGKTVIHHPSPPFSMIKHTTSLFPSNYVNAQYSYPSGHAARALFIALVAWALTRKKWWVGGLLGLYVVLVSVSRIYLGHHWLSDIIGGLLLSSGLGVLTLVI